jgi:hypothetical protein
LGSAGRSTSPSLDCPPENERADALAREAIANVLMLR